MKTLKLDFINAKSYIIGLLYRSVLLVEETGGVLNATLCDKVCQWLPTVRWFSPGTSVSSTNKTDRHDVA